jgi:hypothetical protein
MFNGKLFKDKYIYLNGRRCRMMKFGIFISEEDVLALWSQLRRWFKADDDLVEKTFDKGFLKDYYDIMKKTKKDSIWTDDGKNKNKFNPRWKTVTKSNTSSNFKPTTRSSSVYRRRLRK